MLRRLNVEQISVRGYTIIQLLFSASLFVKSKPVESGYGEVFLGK